MGTMFCVNIFDPWPLQADRTVMGAKYQWSPDPALAAIIGVVTIIIVLIPAVCSVCFRLHLRRHQPDQVRGRAVNRTLRRVTVPGEGPY